MDYTNINNSEGARRQRSTDYEHREQVALFSWADRNLRRYPELQWLHAVPNGGARNPVVAGQMKAEGVRAGVLDVFLDVPRAGYHGLRLEMKRPAIPALKLSAGTVSSAQKPWLDHYTLNGYCAVVAWGFNPARQAILAYLDASPALCQPMPGILWWVFKHKPD